MFMMNLEAGHLLPVTKGPDSVEAADSSRINSQGTRPERSPKRRQRSEWLPHFWKQEIAQCTAGNWPVGFWPGCSFTCILSHFACGPGLVTRVGILLNPPVRPSQQTERASFVHFAQSCETSHLLVDWSISIVILRLVFTVGHHCNCRAHRIWFSLRAKDSTQCLLWLLFYCKYWEGWLW